jgi:predicted dehydrogenase
MAKTLNVGLIGYKFMGKAHSNAYRSVNMFFDCGADVVMKAICGRNRQGVKAAAKQLGWESYETDWKKLVKRPDIDIIDIVTPGFMHCEMAVEAAKAGKHVICEKPLANTVAEAEKMVEAVEKAGVKNMVAYNYRRVPAIVYAKQLIDEGKLGKLFHFRATYLQSWIVDPSFPLVWRLEKDKAGSGALGDIGSHIIDLAHFLVGDIAKLVATTKTFVKQRPIVEEVSGLSATAKGKAKGKVTVDDAVLIMAHFKNGALGSFEATRFATSRMNQNSFEINGSKGSVTFDLEDLNRLGVAFRKDGDLEGFRSVLCTNATHPYMEAWWPPGHIIGWEHTFTHEIADFVKAIVNKTDVKPDFADGLKCDRVMAAVEKSAEKGVWTKP